MLRRYFVFFGAALLAALDGGVGDATAVALRGSPAEDAAELHALSTS